MQCKMGSNSERYNFDLSLHPENDCASSDSVEAIQDDVSIIELSTQESICQVPKRKSPKRNKLCKCRNCDPVSFDKCLQRLFTERRVDQELKQALERKCCNEIEREESVENSQDDLDYWEKEGDVRLKQFLQNHLKEG